MTDAKLVPSAYGSWGDSITELVSYRYLGCRSVAHDRDHATGHMRLRSDLRLTDGLLGAPVAIAVLDTAGISIDGINLLALTRIDVHLGDEAATAEEIALLGQVVRETRKMVFTEARIVDAADEERTLGYGTADWVVIRPTPPGFVYPDPGPGVPDEPPMPPLWEAYDVEPMPGGGYEIAGLSPRIGTEMLHHGPTLVATEAAALEAVEAATQAPARAVETLSTRLVRVAKTGPFRTRAEVLGRGPSWAMCRVELHDVGADAVVATTFLRVRL